MVSVSDVCQRILPMVSPGASVSDLSEGRQSSGGLHKLTHILAIRFHNQTYPRIIHNATPITNIQSLKHALRLHIDDEYWLSDDKHPSSVSSNQHQ